MTNWEPFSFWRRILLHRVGLLLAHMLPQLCPSFCTVCSLETSVAVYQVTWHCITKDCDLHCHCLYSHECFIKYISFCLKLPLEVKVKQVNVTSDMPWRCRWGVQIWLCSFLTVALNESGLSPPLRGHFTPPGKSPSRHCTGGWMVWRRENLFIPPGFGPWTAHPLASCCSNYTVLAPATTFIIKQWLVPCVRKSGWMNIRLWQISSYG